MDRHQQETLEPQATLEKVTKERQWSNASADKEMEVSELGSEDCPLKNTLEVNEDLSLGSIPMNLTK